MRVMDKKPFGNPNAKADITGVFEVLIPNEIWEKLTKARNKHVKLTYSWIVRYALFKLLRRKNFWQKFKTIKLAKKDKTYSKSKENSHRFPLCLYGEDHKRLKVLSAELETSVSLLVRVAILWYLQEFSASTIPDCFTSASKYKKFGKLSFEKIKILGTKTVKDIQTYRKKENYSSLWTLSLSFAFTNSDFW